MDHPLPWYIMMDVQRGVVMKVVAVIGSACLLVFSTDDEEDDDSAVFE